MLIQTTERIGYRSWLLKARMLHSLNHPVVWEGPTLTADRPPEKEHGHGIYCLKKYDPNNIYLQDHWVTGSVALSGKVLEYTDGWRAERATIRSLTLHAAKSLAQAKAWYRKQDTPNAVAQALSERYQVEVALEAWPESVQQAYESWVQQEAAKDAARQGLGVALQAWAEAYPHEALAIGVIPSVFKGTLVVVGKLRHYKVSQAITGAANGASETVEGNLGGGECDLDLSAHVVQMSALDLHCPRIRRPSTLNIQSPYQNGIIGTSALSQGVSVVSACFPSTGWTIQGGGSGGSMTGNP